MMTNEFTNDVNPHIYDNILASLGLLPQIYRSIEAKQPEQRAK
jgi:hypothetical protein